MTAPGPLRFKHAEIRNWRNFTKVDATLARRVFLVGPNASGKSNFLDVFRFLRDTASVGGGLQSAVRDRGGVSSIRSLAARQIPYVGIKVDIGADDSPTGWTYELRFTQDKRKRAQIKHERVVHGGRELLARPNHEDAKDPERLSQTYLEQVNANQAFRPVVEFLESVQYLHVVPQLVREPDRWIGEDHDPYGSDFLERIAQTPQKTQDARLRRVARSLRFAVPQLRELELARDVRGVPHLRGRYEHWRPHGAWQSENQFSDGTLRLMGLLWAVLDGTSPLLLEEPELSLHPEVVRFIPQMLARIQRRSRRQIMLSTHSSTLLLDKGIGLDEVLMLIPVDEGTQVKLAASIPEISALLQGGLTIGDAVMPRTSPKAVDQLSLFGD